MIVERVKAGLARVRVQGKRLGRRPVGEDVVERIRKQLATGAGILKTAKVLGVGTGTVIG
jgi:DNA invertase Pin-like site-specific DNA recombinase